MSHFLHRLKINFFWTDKININIVNAKKVSTLPMAIIVSMDPSSVSRWHHSEGVYQSVRRPTIVTADDGYLCLVQHHSKVQLCFLISTITGVKALCFSCIGPRSFFFSYDPARGASCMYYGLGRLSNL